MINNQRVIALIPARGGSKTIPHKNIKRLAGKPLIGWTIEEALATKEIDRTLVSTDDDKIASIAKQYGAEVINRPKHLAQDDSLPIDVIKHTIQYLKLSESASIMIYLEPTCPLRMSTDFSQSLQILVNENYDSIATFQEADLNPHRAWKIVNKQAELYIQNANPWLPRQKLPEVYQLNGAVYAFYIETIKEETRTLLNGKIGTLIMPKERSIDIDDELDFLLAELLIKRRLST